MRGIWTILQPNLNQQLDSQRRQQVWNELTSLLPEILPGLGLTGFSSFGHLADCAAFIKQISCDAARKLSA